MSSDFDQVGSVDAADDDVDWNELTLDDSEDEEYEFLALPDVDEEYLDGGDGLAESNASEVLSKIPFKTIHNPSLPFEDSTRRCFLPGRKINIEIKDVEQADHSRLLNPNIYIVHIRHGPFFWTIKRRYKHFRHLHEQLMLLRAGAKLPIPTQKHRQRRKSFARKKQSLPKFPKRPDPLIRTEEMDRRKQELQDYLQNVLRHPQFRNHPETLKFLEVSHLSFVNGLGSKWREGIVKKRSGGRKIRLHLCGECCGGCHSTAHYQRRWLVLKDTFVAYVKPETGAVSDVLLMDREFEVKIGLMNTGIRHGMLISNYSRNLLVKCWTQHKSRQWEEQISKAAAQTGKDFTQPNRYESFAPVRSRAYCNWFVDAATYMSAVADGLESAKEEIFITDWWLSPELHLKRPVTEGDKWRLDYLLKRKACQGVKIFVLLFKEIEAALGINSYYSKQTLVGLHPTNIKVMRDPDGLNLWSHHEKCVVIDQRIAFLGGIDLCYGRWDTRLHRLTDLGSVRLSQFYGEGEGDSAQTGELSASANDLRRTLEISTPSATANSTSAPPHKKPGFGLGLPTIEESIDKDLPEIVIERVDSEKTEYTVLTDEEELGEDTVDSPSPPAVEASSTPLQQDKDGGYSNPRRVSLEAEINRNPPLQKKNSAEERRAMFKKAATFPVMRQKSGDTSSSESDEEPESLSREETKNCLLAFDNSMHSLKDGAESLTEYKTIAPSIEPKANGKAEQYGMFHPTSFESSSEDEGIVETDVDSGQTQDEGVMETEVDGGQTQESQPDADLLVKVRSSTIDSSSSLNFDARRGRLDSAGAPVTGPQAFKLYIKDVQQKTFDVPSSCNGGSPNGSLQNGRQQAQMQEQLMKDWDRSQRSSEKETSPKAKRKGLKRAPKLNFDMAHMTSKDQRRGSSSTINSIPASPPINGQAEASSLEHNSSSTLNGSLTPQPTPKPTTPPAKRKFAMRAREIRDRFRKQKSMSIDITDDRPHDDTIYLRKDCEAALDPYKMLEDQGLVGEIKLWMGKDYVNFIFKDFVELDKPFTDMVDRSVTPRMPWHDIGAVCYGHPARDVARHFIQRWNFTKLHKQKMNIDYPMLLPKSYDNFSVPSWVPQQAFTCNCQITRSSCEWSAGIKTIDCSIMNAYVDLIKNSKHYIYIENQFFISIEENPLIENAIGNALYERIMKAHRDKETFRVYVVLPLLPAFEGELGTSKGTCIQAIIHWNYASISRGGHSLLERLVQYVNDPFEYISFYGLRTHEELIGNLTTELVYVHSKMMIVDDFSVIIGSANINDRSLLGKRDSELAIIVQDTHTVPSRMNGKDFQAGTYASSLRKSLFREHLGIGPTDTDIDVTDPVSTEFYKNVWLKQASINTTVYDKVFNCIPTEEVTSNHELREYQKKPVLAQTDPDKARKELKKVRGHLVLMPLQFLIQENLSPSAGTKEAFVPTIVWT